VPRTCTICTHENRAALERALIEGETLRTIADRFSVSKTALVRHKDNHLPAHLMKAKEAARADDLPDQVGHLQGYAGATARFRKRAQHKNRRQGVAQ
jgi:hypothetical protein